MRILHLCTSLDPASGGPANVLARLAPVQAERGHDVRIITADDPLRIESIVAQLAETGPRASAHGPPRGPMARGPGVLGAINVALREGADVVHIHALWQSTPHTGAALARKLRIPSIIRPCGMLDPWSLEQGKLKKRAFLALKGRRDLNRAAALHFTTETERRLAEPLRLRPRAFVIPNGIDWNEFDSLPLPGRFRAALGLGDRPLIVFLSRLHFKKGIDLLLPAFAKAKLDPDTHLALIGPGEKDYIDLLKRLAVELGVGDRVSFPGMMNGAARIEALMDADLFALPSYQENFGVVVIEALAAGTPVLISDQVNIFREVEAAKVGVAVPCAAPAIAERLSSMLSDREALRRQGERGRAWVREKFPWSKIADQIDAMYDAVVRSQNR